MIDIVERHIWSRFVLDVFRSHRHPKRLQLSDHVIDIDLRNVVKLPSKTLKLRREEKLKHNKSHYFCVCTFSYLEEKFPLVELTYGNNEGSDYNGCETSPRH